MREINACLFDLDGVLVDTAIYHYKAWRRLANELGFDFTEKDNEKLKGISRIQSLKLILEWGGIKKTSKEIEELSQKKNDWYLEMIADIQPNELLPGSREFLQELKDHGIKIALGSASKNAIIILDKTNIRHFFDAIVDGNMVQASKPDPEVFLIGAKLLNIQPQQCVVIEDAVAGVEAALAGNMKVIGIGDKGVLKEANLVVASLAEMSIDQLNSL
ncbi:beta-phosphoglucomutase [Albibacterium bauzanense]|uniref:Beta-phosphoglucomutase n=1 Tax=Albibacterium bauzanense TaxID=653929 RepID=A0A4R1LW82_9SPHI|nr:beta-phosphoglucomutase [Albibacterium bauzanense]TCK82674.1 beta-phosphoglucomutase [Albibacterium bauzanense]